MGKNYKKGQNKSRVAKRKQKRRETRKKERSWGNCKPHQDPLFGQKSAKAFAQIAEKKRQEAAWTEEAGSAVLTDKAFEGVESNE